MSTPILTTLREFIYHHSTGLTWQWLQHVARDANYDHVLTVSKVWAFGDAPAHFAGRLKAELRKNGPLFIDGEKVVGAGSLEFCNAVKSLLEQGDLQLLSGGMMQFALDPVTGYHYQNPDPPKLPGLWVNVARRN